MDNNYNTIVVGLGAMGSSAVYHLSKLGIKALGIDIFSQPHNFGSSHGDTRITRQAIGEGQIYTPLSLRSYEIYREIEKISNKKLLEITGGLIISSDSDKASIVHVNRFFENTLEAAQKYNIAHDILESNHIRAKFPQFNIDNDEIGYYEYEAGFLRPELIIKTQLDLAQYYGCQINFNEKLINFDELSNKIIVRTDKNTYIAEKLILTIGPWINDSLNLMQFGELNNIFKVYRQVLFWYDISNNYSEFANMPIFIWQIKGVQNGIYGFPAINGSLGGFKIATADYDYTVSPDSVDRNVTSEEIDLMYKLKVAPFLPKVNSYCLKSAVCLYTVTPDSGFVIDWLPQFSRVLICSSCSGHGFKHSAAIGESLAQLVSEGKSTLDLSAFKLSRFF